MECHRLTKRFGSKVALSDINLDIQPGKITGLLGTNGSGKSTLMKLAAGLLVPTDGEILVNGMKPGIETKKHVSYLPERTYLDEWMKVSDMFMYFNDFYTDFDCTKALDMLKSLNISPNQRLKTMSKGTKEKVQLILVMSRKADLYMLDEPIGGVDPAARDYIIKTIITNYSENSGVLISTHLITDIENVLDDIIILNNGVLMEFCGVDELREKKGKSVDAYFREVFRC